MADHEEDDMLDDDETAPFAANAENRQLDKEVKVVERRLLQAEADVEETKARTNAMSDHVKSVQQEIQQTQGLLDARKREVDSEQHFKTLAEQEHARLAAEIKRAKESIAETTDVIQTNHAAIAKHLEKMEALKTEMKWNEQELQAWIEKTKLVDEDAAVIEKYTRADESRVKALTLEIDRLTQEATKAYRELEAELTETHAQQMGLDKAAEDFRRIHAERQQLIAMWEQTVTRMQGRDSEIEASAQQFQHLKGVVAEKEFDVRERQRYVDQERAANAEVEKQVAAVERQAQRMRLDVQAQEAALQQLMDETNTLRNIVSRTSADVEGKRRELQQLDAQTEEKEAQGRVLKVQTESMAARLEQAGKKVLTAEEITKSLEAMMADLEKEEKAIVQRVASLRDVQFKQTQTVHDLRTQEQNLQADIQGGVAMNKNISSQISRLDQEALQQQQLLYQQDFQISALERKLARLQGEKSEEEEKEVAAKIAGLKAELAKHTETQTLLSTQLRRVEDESRQARRALDRSQAEKAGLTDKLETLALYLSSAEQELKQTVREKQDLMVEENVLKLEVRRLRSMLNARADDVMTLEQRKLQLKTAMDERAQEIRLHMDMIAAQTRAAEDERAEGAKEFRDRAQRIDQLKKRYEIMMSTLTPPGEDEPKSQAYYVIKAAQEREELQRQGDDLDSRIRKGEKEIRALENTLRLMNSRNDKLKTTLLRPEGIVADVEEKDALTAQFQTAMETLRSKKRDLASLQAEADALRTDHTSAGAQAAAVRARLDQLQQSVSGLAKELQEQEEKRERAMRQAARLVKQLRQQQGGVEGETLEEREARLQHVQEFNSKILAELDGIVQHFPDIAPEVSMLLSQAGLALPSRSKAAPRAGGSSVASSVPSVASTRRASKAAGSTAADAAAAFQAKQGQAVAPKTIDFGGPLASAIPPSSAAGGGAARPASAARSMRSVASSRASATSTRPDTRLEVRAGSRA